MAGLEEWLPPASAGTETGLQIAQVYRFWFGSRSQIVVMPRAHTTRMKLCWMP